MIPILQIIFISSILLSVIILNIKVWKNFGFIRAKLPLFTPYTLNFWAEKIDEKDSKHSWHFFTYVFDGKQEFYYIDGKESTKDEWERFGKPS